MGHGEVDNRKVIPHPDPILKQPPRLEKAVKFFTWLDEMTMSMWEIEKPNRRARRKYIQVRVDARYEMLEKLKLWTRLGEAGLRVAPTYTKGGGTTVFRLRFDCFGCASEFARIIRERCKRDGV